MAFTEAYKQDTVSISTTEYSLTNNSTTIATQTTDGSYSLWLDTTNMAAGDIYELRIYEKVTSTAAAAKLKGQVITLADAQAGAYECYLGVLMNGWDVTLKRTAGSDRNFSWSIRQVA